MLLSEYEGTYGNTVKHIDAEFDLACMCFWVLDASFDLKRGAVVSRNAVSFVFL